MPSDTEPGSEPPATPYNEMTHDDYGSQVAATFAAIPTDGGVILSGACPRCTDPMGFPHVSEVFKVILPARRTTDPSTSKLPMICTCKETHPGQPTDVEGCGAYWNITLTVTTP